MSLRDLFRRPGRASEAGESTWPQPTPQGGTSARMPVAHEVHASSAGRRSDRELWLAEGGTVCVTEEQHYQLALSRIRGSETAREVVVSVQVNEQGNPWSRKPTGPVLEIKVHGETVGFLTTAMTARYRPFADVASSDGRVLTAKAWVGAGSRASGRDVEITLSAIPRPAVQCTIAGLDVETSPDYVLTVGTGVAHVITSELSSGWLVECGQQLESTDAELILTTKPWVGRVRADGSIVEEWPRWCETCRPDRASVEDGGRFGDYTSIRNDNRFSAAMTVEAVSAALESRLDFDVAGESFRHGYPDTLLGFAEVLRAGRPGERLAVVLRRDPSNPHDANAIEVHVPGEAGHVGFVPGALARLLAPMLDAGQRIRSSAVEVRIHEDAPDRPGLTVSLQHADDVGA